jgi:gamma-glutamylcyclotransferase (GGCT)/AIG2-like uncharacterized protein YtfP
MQNKILYFAYGHNTNTKELRKRCPHATLIGKAVLPHYRLELLHYTTLVPDKNSSVYGVLYGLDDSDIHRLDKKEGYHIDYNHKLISVEYHGRYYKALTYIMIPHQHAYKIPSRQYIELVKQGYLMNHLPIKQLKHAYDTRKETLKLT